MCTVSTVCPSSRTLTRLSDGRSPSAPMRICNPTSDAWSTASATCSGPAPRDGSHRAAARLTHAANTSPSPQTSSAGHTTPADSTPSPSTSATTPAPAFSTKRDSSSAAAIALRPSTPAHIAATSPPYCSKTSTRSSTWSAYPRAALSSWTSGRPRSAPSCRVHAMHTWAASPAYPPGCSS